VKVLSADATHLFVFIATVAVTHLLCGSVPASRERMDAQERPAVVKKSFPDYVQNSATLSFEYTIDISILIGSLFAM